MADILGKKGDARVMKWMNLFEALLGDKPYMTGDKATWVDYCVMQPFEVLAQKQAKGVEDVKGIELTPKVKAWYEKMGEDAAVKKVRAMAPGFMPESMV